MLLLFNNYYKKLEILHRYPGPIGVRLNPEYSINNQR